MNEETNIYQLNLTDWELIAVASAFQTMMSARGYGKTAELGIAAGKAASANFMEAEQKCDIQKLAEQIHQLMLAGRENTAKGLFDA
jgi:hypothetical protein